jgi:hypothetical protein
MHQKHPPANVAIFVLSFMVKPPPSFLSSPDGAPRASPGGAHKIKSVVKQARIVAPAETRVIIPYERIKSGAMD